MISESPIALVLPKALSLAAIIHQWYKSCLPHLMWLSCVWPQTAAQDLQRQCCGWKETSLWHLQIFRCFERARRLLLTQEPQTRFCISRTTGTLLFWKAPFYGNPLLTCPTENNILAILVYGLPPRLFLWAVLMGMQRFKPEAGYSGIQNPEMTN